MKQVTPPEHTLSIIVLTVEATPDPWILDMTKRCRYLRPYEFIVVLDRHRKTVIAQAKEAGCTIHAVDQAVSVDDRRVMGAKAAKGTTVLFLEQDCRLEPEQLLSFLQPVLYGSAHAVTPHRKPLQEDICLPQTEEVWAACFNRLMNREDLLACSMNDTPYALTQHALSVLGTAGLQNPIAAYAALMKSGLKIARYSYSAPVTKSRYTNLQEHGAVQYELSPYERKTIDRYLQAFASYIAKPRGGFPDGNRRRDLIEKLRNGITSFKVVRSNSHMSTDTARPNERALSVIVPARNEEATIAPLLEQLHRLEPAELIVVVNGSQDRTCELALAHGATVVLSSDALGTDTGRALGAYHATGRILLFVDGDMVLSAHDLYPFVLAIRQGYDVALNDQNYHLEREFPLRSILPSVYALNLALDQKPLGTSSMVMVPFGLSRKALNAIGWESLLCPPRALAASVRHALRIVLPHRVNVEKANRLRPEKHLTGTAINQIVGDHIEALHSVLDYRNH
ncbi:glycosyltransferase family 2 protein [Paenibacillus silviterrae]|uniref:glycosyltransferase family 2 protein n=1 Tax=Paenibacillus silviterrae TaxID=3242194 RepID=UPI002542B893|nr:glycosyltransferase [Paenibacillus chinjuensis]